MFLLFSAAFHDVFGDILAVMVVVLVERFKLRRLFLTASMRRCNLELANSSSGKSPRHDQKNATG